MLYSGFLNYYYYYYPSWILLCQTQDLVPRYFTLIFINGTKKYIYKYFLQVYLIFIISIFSSYTKTQ